MTTDLAVVTVVQEVCCRIVIHQVSRHSNLYKSIMVWIKSAKLHMLQTIESAAAS